MSCRSSPRRQTPSPSELIRMSMSSRESSRHSSQASLLDFDNKQPGQSQRVPPSTSQSQPSYDLTVQSQSTYPDFSQAQADIGRPPISQPSTSQYNTGLSTYNKVNYAKVIYLPCFSHISISQSGLNYNDFTFCSSFDS